MSSNGENNAVANSSNDHSPSINPHKNQFNLLSHQQALPSAAIPIDEQSTNSGNQNVKKIKPKKKRPQLQQTPSFSFQHGNSTSSKSSKYVYSVDDDLDEIEQDMEREYLEGYQDALRYRFKRSAKNLKEYIPKSLYIQQQQANHSLLSPEVQSITQEVYTDLQHASSNLKKLEQRETDYHTHLPNSHSPHIQDEVSQTQDQDEDNNGGDNQENSDDAEDSDVHEDEIGDINGETDIRSISSEESFTLRERQDAINTTHPFGIRIWKPAVYKKIRSVQKEADVDIHEVDETRKKKITRDVQFANFLWCVTFGALLFGVCFVGSIILILCGSLNYSKVFFNLGTYLLWPFGKLVYLQQDENYLNEDRNDGTTFREYERWRDEEQNKLFFSASRQQGGAASLGVLYSIDHIPISASNSSSSIPFRPQIIQSTASSTARIPAITEVDDEDEDEHNIKRRFFGRGDWNLGRIVFYLFFYFVLYPITTVIWLLCWLMVFTIPMAKVLKTLSTHLKKHPLALFYKFDMDPRIKTNKNSNVLICTYRASGFHYYKYTVEGTNIFFINLMAVVFYTIFAFFGLKKGLGLDNAFTDESVIFGLCLLSIIPLAYFIGQAVASISAQSSMGLGAVINAFFSTIVEIFLYCVALNQEKGSLVEGSMIGSILGAVLLLPGLSMCAGALKRKTQRYNPASAGVSSTMLIFSLMVMFSPTLFFQIYGNYEVDCKPCVSSKALVASKPSCQNCHFSQPPLKIDELFTRVLKPFSIICAILLFLAYIIGLWFTLRTHAALIWQTPITEKRPTLQHTESSQILDAQHQQAAAAAPIVEEAGGHDAPNWSKNKSTFVLLSATILYAIIAEILVDCVDSVLKEFPIDPKFLGITIFALVPNTTEFLNAISFATHGNVALSMEIGSAYALQVVLIQIPSLVLYSLYFIDTSTIANVKESMFTLIFPKWDLFASVISVVLFTYIYAEGKSNYFKGSILILGYVVCVVGFYFVSVINDDNEFLNQSFRFIVNV